MAVVLSRHRDEAYAESLVRQVTEKKCKRLDGDVGAARDINGGTPLSWAVGEGHGGRAKLMPQSYSAAQRRIS